MIQDDLRKLAELRGLKESKELEVKAINADIEQITRRASAEMLETGVTTIKLDDVGSFTVTEDLFPKIVSRSELFNYLRENDQSEVIKEQVHSSTLRAMNKNYNEEFGKDLPGCESYSKISIKVRKS